MTENSLIISTHELCYLHDPGPQHPERPARLTAIRDGIAAAGLNEAVTWVEAPEASVDDIAEVHPRHLLGEVNRLAKRGGGSIDPDTYVSAKSGGAALRAAGSGLDLIHRLENDEADIGWSVVRPPGHHATRTTQMGFCLLNNVAITAQALAGGGERVAVIDVDAHHGNGTQDVFYDTDQVLFVSFHQYPWYPYTGAANEVGKDAGEGYTINVPFAAGTTGEYYRQAMDEIVAPRVAAFDPHWVLVSVGFDGHRDDPLTNLGLTSADYADLVAEVVSLGPPGRRMLFLEGGYNLDAMSDSAGALVSKLLGESFRPEEATTGGPGAEAIAAVKEIQAAYT